MCRPPPEGGWSSAGEPSPHPLPPAPAPRHGNMASMYLGSNAARHENGPEGIGMGAGGDQGGGGGHDRVVVLVAEL